MRHFLYSFTFLLLAAMSCSAPQEQKKPEAAYQSIDTVPMLVMQIQQCSKLYTAEYHIHKIVTHDDVVRLKGSFLQQAFSIKLPLGQRKIAIPMDATLKAYIDFGDFGERNIERQGNQLTILLPDPKVTMTSSKIDQKNIKQYVGFVRQGFTDEEMANYEQQGRAAILQNITSLGIIETAKENAARVLVPMLTQMGFDERNITIAYRKNYTERDINSLLDLTNIAR